MNRMRMYLRATMALLVIAVSVLGFDASARRLSATEAWARISPASRAGSQMHKLAYESPQSAYYVFTTEDQGYIVASGDDCVTPVLAVVPDGHFDLDSLPDAMRWILDCYQQEIACKSAAKTQSSETDEIASLYESWTEIKPVMTCAWSQGSPYNDLCPVVSGSRSLTGCVATAMAQVIRTIGYAKGSGRRTLIYDSKAVEFDYEANPIDFDNLLDAYNYGDSQGSLTAVANLMLACGIGVGMNYSPSASSAQTDAVAPALISYFGYDKTHTRGYRREDCSTVFWESLIYAELLERRPVYYSGSSRVSAHAFVVDGYKPEGLWHINWGWGGRDDGYFHLPDLNPTRFSDDGDMTSGGGYNSAQYLVKSVPPNAIPGLVVSDLSGSLSKVSEDVYYVYFKSNGRFLLNIALGAIIVGEDDATVSVWQPFWTGQSINSTGSIYHSSYRYDFSQADLAPGKYRIYPAVLLDGEDEAIICDAVSGRSHYLSLTVDNNRRYTITNSQIVTGSYTYELSVAEAGENVLYAGFASGLSLYIVNDGGGDYCGTVYFNLLQPDSGDKVVSQGLSGVVIPAGYNTRIAAPFRAVYQDGTDLQPGVYTLSLTNSSGIPILKNDSELRVTVLDTYPPGIEGANSDIYIRNAASIPEYYAQGDWWEHIPNLDCEKEYTDATLSVAFYPPGMNTGAKRYVFYRGDLGYVHGSFRQPNFMIDLPFGIYDACYCMEYSQISSRRTVRIGQQFGDLFYIPVDDKTVAVCHHPQRAYRGFVSIPETIDIDGKTYTVSQLNNEAFLGCHSLEVLRLPATINKIGRNALLYCSGLSNLIFDGEQVPFDFRNYVMSGSKVPSVYVPATSYTPYNDMLGTYHDVYASIKQISSARVNLSEPVGSVELDVLPAHEAINGEFLVELTSEEAVPAADITGIDLVGDKLILTLVANHRGTATYKVRSVQPTVEPAILTVDVTSTTSLDDVVADPQSQVEQIYDLQGRRTQDYRGLRIIVRDGKARVVKY